MGAFIVSGVDLLSGKQWGAEQTLGAGIAGIDYGKRSGIVLKNSFDFGLLDDEGGLDGRRSTPAELSC